MIGYRLSYSTKTSSCSLIPVYILRLECELTYLVSSGSDPRDLHRVPDQPRCDQEGDGPVHGVAGGLGGVGGEGGVRYRTVLLPLLGGNIVKPCHGQSERGLVRG